MDIKDIQVVTTIISTIAACVSVFFAMQTQKLQKNLIQNKSTFEDIIDLITQLKVANAMHQHALVFSDEEFEKGIDLSDVPSKIARLIQHEQISDKIKASEWALPIENLTDKISMLLKIRDSLL